MKIVFSTDQIYLHGGIEKVLVEKANYMAEVCGYEVVILTIEQRENPSCYRLNPKIKMLDLGINYERSYSYFSGRNLRKLPQHFFKLKSTLKKLNADAVIVSNFGFDFYIMPFINRKLKKIKEFHGSRYFEARQREQVSSLLKKMKYILNDWLESQYHHIVVLNQDEKKYYNSDNVVVIPNPISIPTLEAPLISKKVVAAGRIAPVKAFDKLIEAWEIVHSEEPEWELHFYGEDYLDTQKLLESLVVANRLEKVVFFKGSASDMTAIFSEYSLYAMSSITECFPMVLLEALAVGLPVVSFDCPHGPRNIISHKEDGLLVKNQDVSDLAEKILFLIQNRDVLSYYGQNAKKNSRRFAVDKVMQQWLILLNS